MSLIDAVRGRLIVSCQALPDEPLHGAPFMARMALAAAQGGAAAIRANSAADITAIKQAVSLPVIGIVKREYPDSEVYITPTLSEVEELTGCGADVIALDATARTRPGRVALPDIVKTIRARHPRQLLMADISTPAEARDAERLGFDMVATTLYGYTRDTAGRHLYDDDFAFLRQVVAACRMPVIAEGNVLTPEAARRTIELGAWAVVVGGAITRPQHITRRFAMALTPAAR